MIPRKKTSLTGMRRYPVIPILILMLILILPSFFAHWLAPYDPYESHLRDRLKPPLFFGGTSEYILGTDRLGRDILSRIMHGSKYALAIAGAGILCGGLIGSFLGLCAGYMRGWVDVIVMRLVDISFALPSILLALALATVWPPSFGLVIFVVTFILWSYFARQVRAEVLSLRERDFIARARVAGASHLRILIVHILPNVTNTIVVLATLQIGVVILLESILSFLGIGIPRPNPAWGLLVADGRALVVDAWWISFFPGIAILLKVMAVNLLGDWVRDHLDPKIQDI